MLLVKGELALKQHHVRRATAPSFRKTPSDNSETASFLFYFWKRCLSLLAKSRIYFVTSFWIELFSYIVQLLNSRVLRQRRQNCGPLFCFFLTQYKASSIQQCDTKFGKSREVGTLADVSPNALCQAKQDVVELIFKRIYILNLSFSILSEPTYLTAERGGAALCCWRASHTRSEERTLSSCSEFTRHRLANSVSGLLAPPAAWWKKEITTDGLYIYFATLTPLHINLFLTHKEK